MRGFVPENTSPSSVILSEPSFLYASHFDCFSFSSFLNIWKGGGREGGRNGGRRREREGGKDKRRDEERNREEGEKEEKRKEERWKRKSLVTVLSSSSSYTCV